MARKIRTWVDEIEMTSLLKELVKDFERAVGAQERRYVIQDVAGVLNLKEAEAETFLTQKAAETKAAAEKRVARNRRARISAAGVRAAYTSAGMRKTPYGWE